MAESFPTDLSRFWREGPRDRSYFKGHAVCGIEELLVFIKILRQRDLQVTKIVTAKQTQFGCADLDKVATLSGNPSPGQ